MAIRKLAFILFGLVLLSCKKDKPMELQKTPYFGSELKTNGYYYSSVIDDEGVQRYAIVVLYRDGTFLFPGIEREHNTSLSEIEAEIVNGNAYANSADRKLAWGLFLVDNDELTVENWFPVLFRGMHTVQSRAIIENDSTFTVQPNDKKGGWPERTYYFKAFSPKPDSTNAFI